MRSVSAGSVARLAEWGSLRADGALERIEGHLPVPSGWTRDAIRASIVPRQRGDAGSVRDLGVRRTVWRAYWQLRVICGATAGIWALSVAAGQRHGELDAQIHLGVVLIVAWVGATTLWSSFLHEQLILRPWLSAAEAAFWIGMLLLGGGIQSAFVAFAGLGLAAPAYAAGMGGLSLALAAFLVALPTWWLVWRELGGDPRLAELSPILLVENSVTYTALAILLGVSVYSIGRLERLGRLESEASHPDDERWAVAVTSAARELRELREEYAPRLRALVGQGRGLLDGAGSVAASAGAVIDGLDRALTTIEPEQITLGQLLEAARVRLTTASIARLAESAELATLCLPEPYGRRLTLPAAQADLLSRFADEAVQNMVAHGAPPFRVEAHVRFGPEDRPEVPHQVAVTFINAVASRVSPAGHRGLGLAILGGAALRLGEFIEPEIRASGGRGDNWQVGVAFDVELSLDPRAPSEGGGAVR